MKSETGPRSRRTSGATHSFRLSIRASDIVDARPPFRSLEGRPYPRSLGGKSFLVSEAICFYFGGEEGTTINDQRKHIAWLVQRVKTLEAEAHEARYGRVSAPPMGGRRSILHRIRYWIWANRP